MVVDMIDRTGNDSVDRGGVVRPGRDVEYFPGGFLRLKNNVADCTGDIIDRDNIEDRAASARNDRQITTADKSQRCVQDIEQAQPSGARIADNNTGAEYDHRHIGIKPPDMALGLPFGLLVVI